MSSKWSVPFKFDPEMSLLIFLCRVYLHGELDPDRTHIFWGTSAVRRIITGDEKCTQVSVTRKKFESAKNCAHIELCDQWYTLFNVKFLD